MNPLREPAERGDEVVQVAPDPTGAPVVPTVARVLTLQRSAGNGAVSRMLQREPTAVADEEKTKRPAGKRPKATGTSSAAQKKGSAPNAYGEFNWDITKAAGDNGCDVQIGFKAFAPEVDATQITIIQAVKSTKAGATYYPNNNKTYYQPLESATGLRTDATTTETDPFYNYDDKAQADETTGTTGATRTDMTDGPSLNLIPGKDASQVFETAAFALAGKDEGEFFGTIKWGWDIDATGKYTLHDPVVSDDITTDFGAALRKFIARKHELTKTGTTPAPAELEMPLDLCRALTAPENTKLKTFAEYAKKAPNARIWVVARYSGKTGGDPEHRMAIDNARTVQNGLKALGATDAAVHITALEDSSAKERVSPIEVTVIDT